MFGFSVQGINNVGEWHHLRNELAHEINEVTIENKEITFKYKGAHETVRIEKIIEDIKNYIKTIADRMLNSSYTL